MHVTNGNCVHFGRLLSLRVTFWYSAFGTVCFTEILMSNGQLIYYKLPAESSGWLFFHHLQGAGHTVAAPLQATQLVKMHIVDRILSIFVKKCQQYLQQFLESVRDKVAISNALTTSTVYIKWYTVLQYVEHMN